jgi:hypothetical protein
MSANITARIGPRILACAAILMAVAACEPETLAQEDQPLVTVKGEVVTADGAPATGCKLEFYDTATVKPNFVWDVPAKFTQQLQTGKVTRDFYFRVRCEGQRVAARSPVYDMAYLSNNDFMIDLGRMSVGSGMVTATGMVATADGSTPESCQLGLYTGFHSKPVTSWEVAGKIEVEFEREKVDEHFQFRLQCDGYSQPYISPNRPESWLNETGGRIELGNMLVRR